MEVQYNGEVLSEIRSGFETAYVDGGVRSNPEYRPRFISNDYKQGKKVLSSIEDELMSCDSFRISVAFITMGGIAPLLQTLRELEKKGVRGKILTTNYLTFSEPRALEKLNDFSNITLKMYDTEMIGEGFHTKGYIFQKDEVFRIIIGSSNITRTALTTNKEWNTRIVSTEKGEMTQSILNEFDEFWNDEHALEYDAFYEKYREQYRIVKKQREITKREEIPSVERYRLKPNSMQAGFIVNLKKIISAGEDRALLISATGTGKTYASAFAMRELNFKRVLFLVHRSQLAHQTVKSYKKVFGNSVSMGLVGGGYTEYDSDYVFATIQTLNKDEHLYKYNQDEFDCIILDEAHHSSADSYKKVMRYFRPKLWLGMTATPDKRDDGNPESNIYKLFNYQIAYEIRLQQAMEENMLCPFHYFGISDVSLVDEKKLRSRMMSERDFSSLTGDERVRHIIEQAEFYGYSGDRVKGLVFCSRIDEAEELSEKFNVLGYRTIALNGSASESERTCAFERLAMDEEKATEEIQPLDYIFSVEILNEGVDIVEVNQVIMLRPTESPIVFIQQLGRGLRKVEGKEYVVVLDFIGNYNNNFMIPVALSGDRSYNSDTIRKYVISGNSTIPGASTIHFDEVSKEKIFASINKIKGMKSIIRSSYINLKNRLGRIPYLKDFYENGEVDPLVVVREYKTYYGFLEAEEKVDEIENLSQKERLVLEYLSKTVLSGSRPYELEILKRIMKQEIICMDDFVEEFIEDYGFSPDMKSVYNAIDVLKGHFVGKEEELRKYSGLDIIDFDTRSVCRIDKYKEFVIHREFYRQVNDIVNVGLMRYRERYHNDLSGITPFVLYEKYSRRDVSLLMNCGRDLSSTMYGMKRVGNDVFIFVTYHKQESKDDTELYVSGKPDYADVFEDNLIFRWDSQIGKGVDSTYMNDVCTAERKHLLVKKSDAETNFYYMGEFDILEVRADKKRDKNGRERDISKVKVQMKHPVRDDILRYLQSCINENDEMVV